jgi:outer membrane protein assembly factor BamB
MGITAEKDLPTTWGGKENVNVLWTAPLPGATTKVKFDHNQSSPIVWGDRVFLIMVYWPEGVAQNKYPEHRIACYSTKDGKQLWDQKVEPGPWLLNDFRGGYSCCTPCTDGERVYALFGSSVLAALNFDGKVIWRKEIAPYGWDVAVSTSPVFYKDTVLVLADAASGKNSRLIAYDTKSGEIRWEQKRPTSSFSHSTPVLVEIKGKPQLLIAASNAVQGVDPEDGKLIWWVNHKGDVPTPVLSKGIVYSEDGRGGAGIAIDPTGEGDGTKTMVKWRTKGNVAEGYSSPTIVGDYVYRMHNPGVLKCWNLSTGEQVYSERMPNGLDAAVSPIVTPEGRLYFICGGKSAIVPGGPKFEILATNDLGDSSTASGAIADGRIYIKGGKNLYCIGNK